MINDPNELQLALLAKALQGAPTGGPSMAPTPYGPISTGVGESPSFAPSTAAPYMSGGGTNGMIAPPGFNVPPTNPGAYMQGPAGMAPPPGLNMPPNLRGG